VAYGVRDSVTSKQKFWFCLIVIESVILLAFVLALGHVEEKTSHGLLVVIALLQPVFVSIGKRLAGKDEPE
jgi:hypothetical protein